MKNQLTLMFSKKKLLTNLTLPQTHNFCYLKKENIYQNFLGIGATIRKGQVI